MYFITSEEWDQIPNDYKIERSENSVRAVFESCLNDDGEGGTNLILEYKHFIVLPEDITTGDPDKDALTCKLLTELSTATPDDKNALIEMVMDEFGDHSNVCEFTKTAVRVADEITGRRNANVNYQF